VKVDIELYCIRMIYMCRLRFKIIIHSMRYVYYNFFFLNIQVEIGNYDLYLYAIVSQIFELL
jgi:hypothetical protein